MIPTICFGTGTGVGLWLLLIGAWPARPALGARLTPAHAPAPADPITTTAATGWVTTCGRWFVPSLRALKLPGTRIGNDLRVLERHRDSHLAAKAILAIAGLLVPLLLQALLILGGLSLSITIPLVAGLVLAALGFLVPDLEVRTRAARARAEFRTALSAFLDLVWITLAGGAGVEVALLDAVTVGYGPAFAHLRRAIDAARLTRTTVWTSLEQLGDELDIAELSELAATVSLAGSEGAAVRTSLAAKAGALRTHQVTDAEAQAQAATERMALPVTLLFLGFLGFIAYPAITQVLTGL
ncbi:hypothetical protein [Sciscionella marina]|uniref:hypothetical protein n=1 Tax=Sciscionella marina TaxID=508770 RepID=UPI0003619633|nr:hypothetical protein [Sciscionella marina]